MPVTGKRRTIFASLALVAGFGLIYFEMIHRRRVASAGEFWFWVSVALLLILFALAELFLRPNDPH